MKAGPAGCRPVKGSKVGPFRARTPHTTGDVRVNTARVYTARAYTAYTARGYTDNVYTDKVCTARV